MKVVPGDVLLIPDAPKANYFAAVAKDFDILFFDTYASINEQVRLPEAPYFLRLSVSLPSIRRAKWQKIARTRLEGPLSEYGQYLLKPSDAQTDVVYSNFDASIREATDKDQSLERLAVWDARLHVVPILRCHFFGEETPLRKMIAANL